MKKATPIILGIFCLGILAAPALAAATHDDFRVIQRAVKKNPAYEPGREVRWLKILIMDRHDRKGRVQVTLPLAVIDVIVNCADGHHFKVDDGGCEIDLKALYRDLKKAGPSALFELRGDDGLIKIWLE